MKRIKLIQICGLTAVLILSACGGGTQKSTQSTPTSGKAIIGIDESFRPFMDEEIMVFEGLYNTANLQPVYYPENESYKYKMSDSVYLFITTSLFTEKEMAYYKSKSLYPKTIPVAHNAIAFLVNRSNPDSMLTTRQIQQIMTGKIQDWKQINPKSNLGQIGIVFDNENSSTVRYVMDSICGKDKLTGYINVMKKNVDLVDYVAKNKNSIGIIGVSWISDKRDSLQRSFLKKIQVVSVSKEDVATYEESYPPLAYYVFKGKYPYVQTIYAVNLEPWDGLSTGFLNFLASDKGQRIILKTGVFPYQTPGRDIIIRNDY
jgi:phosphate transport system substrate-binding protein